jgi:hypothetical protein
MAIVMSVVSKSQKVISYADPVYPQYFSSLVERNWQSFLLQSPSSKYINHRYCMICMADVFGAIVIYKSSVLQKWPTRRDGTYEQRIKWSHPCFDESKKNPAHSNIP